MDKERLEDGAPKQQTPKDVVKEFADQTTCHGLSRISGSPYRWLQALWAALTVVCSVVVIWQISILINKFYSYPVIVEVTYAFKDLAFPAVTFCNHNRFRKSQQALGGEEFQAAIGGYGSAIESDMTGPTDEESRRRRKRREAGDLTTTTEPETVPAVTEEPCVDLHGSKQQCEDWRDDGECFSNPGYMLRFCMLTCDACPLPPTEAATTTAPPPVFTPAPGGDPVNDFFAPNISLEDKPWFQPDEVQPAIATEIAENMTSLLRSVPLSAQREMGHRIDTLIQECTFNGRQCTPLNFSGMSSPTYGNCYTFNQGTATPALYVEKEGPLYGLTVVLFLEQDEYIESLSPSAGARVLIHHRDEQPFPEDDGTDANPGQKLSLKLSMTQKERLEEPYSNCTKDHMSLSKILLYDRNYSVRACRKSCLQKHIYDECGCGNPGLPLAAPRDKACGDKKLRCMERATEKVNAGNIDDEDCACPIRCSDLSINVATSTAEWPAESYRETLAELYSTRSEKIAAIVQDPEELKKNFLKMEIYFEELRIKREEESPSYRMENLMGDIGGQLGLWIGISMLTVAEFGQLFFEVLTLGFRNKRNKVATIDKRKV